jgi:hypothetical protein
MTREQWGAVKLAGGVTIVVLATLGVLAGVTWVPAAAVPVFVIFALVREPPQGTGEWLLLGALAFAGALLAIVVASLNTP